MNVPRWRPPLTASMVNSKKLRGQRLQGATAGDANSGFLDEQLPEDALGESSKVASDAPPAASDPSGLDLGSPAETATAATAPEMAPAEASSMPPDATSTIAGVDPGSPPPPLWTQLR